MQNAADCVRAVFEYGKLAKDKTNNLKKSTVVAFADRARFVFFSLQDTLLVNQKMNHKGTTDQAM